MSAPVHTLALVLITALAYFWLHSPLLEPFSLQAFAGSVLLYFVLKRLGKAKLWHIAPTTLSLEMVVATFAFLLVVGATGNLESPVWALSYVHLFFLVLSAPVGTSIIMTLVIMLFHYLMGGYDWTLDWPTFASLPILTLLFLFAKQQHEEVIKDKALLSAEEVSLEASQTDVATLTTFLSDFAHPKLEQIKALTSNATANKDAIIGQVTLLQIEIQKVLRHDTSAE